MASLLQFPDVATKRRIKEEQGRAAQQMFYTRMVHEAIDILNHLPIEYVYRIFDRANTLIAEHESR